MPSKRQYDLVQNDDYDIRISLHPEEAFHHGITFQAKYIGMLDVLRPTSRVEIVAAMRKIRYEFKTKGIKKKKVTIQVSVDGVKVTLRKMKKRKDWLDDGKFVSLNHPIYRIFYVSHDSQDLKIFSYIARDGASNLFKCAVFKSNKKSQAMRIVRTIGQAFEVCHKLSINAPENDHLDREEQTTLTQDLFSDRPIDISSDNPKKGFIAEGTDDKMALPTEDCRLKEPYSDNIKNTKSPPQNDILAPPLNTIPRKSTLTSTETYCLHNDSLATVNVDIGSSSLPVGNALSTHHEIQLMREQLEQHSQQTQAAMAHLQLVKDQLAAEQSARLEAQARTHQLLVHNRELVDYIAVLVAHLQGGENTGQQSTSPHMTMPQNQHPPEMDNNYKTDLSKTMSPDSPVGLSPQGLIENRAVTSCLPTSPLRGTFNPSGSVFNFPYSQPIDTMPFESQLLQRIQTLSGYNSPSPFSYNYNQSLPFLSSTLYNQPLLNNNYTLQSAPQMKIPQSPLALRHSYTTNTETGTKLSPTKYSEPRQMSASQYQTQSNPVQYQQTQQNSQYEQQQQSTQKQSIQRLKMPENRQQRVPNPNPQECSQNERKESQFIKPLAQMGTLTTTDTEGRVRIIVPVPSNSNDTANLLLNLSLTDDLRPLNRPTITRSTSEKVPNRSELMSQVQRGAWARHTTK